MKKAAFSLALVAAELLGIAHLQVVGGTNPDEGCMMGGGWLLSVQQLKGPSS